MKCVFAFGVTAAFLSPFIDAAILQKRDDKLPRVVGLPIKKEPVTDPLGQDRTRMRKRATLEATLDNEQSLYFANITLGTPGQPFRVHIDTGSSDLWVNAASSKICTGTQTVPGDCGESGTYSANSSSTYTYVESNFNISYQDGTGAVGDYATDNMIISGATVKDLQFGIGYQSSSAEAVLGIGYIANEVQVSQFELEPYSNLPAALVQQGIISANAYSLWLNDLDAHAGNILFGGVDTERFTGTLATLPIQKTSGGYTDFLITLTKISIGDQIIIGKQAQAVLLDSGSSLTYLPNTMATAIYEAVGAQYDSTQGAAFVPCNLRSNASTLDFTFSSPTINVPLKELIMNIPSTAGQPVIFPDGAPACVFGIAPSGVNVPILGDTFLRSAYVVYDLGNNKISIAQTKFNATGTNVVQIESGKTGLSKIATAVSHPVAATAGVGTNAHGKDDPGAEDSAAMRIGVSPLAVGLFGFAILCTGLL